MNTQERQIPTALAVAGRGAGNQAQRITIFHSIKIWIFWELIQTCGSRAPRCEDAPPRAIGRRPMPRAPLRRGKRNGLLRPPVGEKVEPRDFGILGAARLRLLSPGVVHHPEKEALETLSRGSDDDLAFGPRALV